MSTASGRSYVSAEEIKITDADTQARKSLGRRFSELPWLAVRKSIKLMIVNRTKSLLGGSRRSATPGRSAWMLFNETDVRCGHQKPLQFQKQRPL